MPDGILSIGAVFEKAQLEGDFTSANEMIKAATDSMSMSFESSNKKTRQAVADMREVVLAFGKDVSITSLQAAESFKSVVVAQQQVRQATILMKDSAVDANVATLAMAAAQRNLAGAQAENAARTMAAASEQAAAAREAALSSNGIVAAYQRAALSVRESLTEIQEKLVETAETGKLTGEGIAAGFAGIGSLLGAGIVVGFATHFLDETAKVVIELDHLHEKTGIAIQSLAGLQEMVKESGAEWDPVATGLMRMNKALADSTEPSKSFVSALGGINLTVGELKGLQPEEQLQKIAIAFAQTENHGNLAAAAVALFGRGGYALIPILHEQGAALMVNAQAAGHMTGVTQQATDAAHAWQETTARLAAEFRGTMIPVIGVTEQVIAKLAAAIELTSGYVYALIDAIVPLAKNLQTIGGVIYDAMTGNFNALKNDTKELTRDLARTWEDYGQRVAEHLRDANERWHWQPTQTTERLSVEDNGQGKSGNTDGVSNGNGGHGRVASIANTVTSARPESPQTQSVDLSQAQEKPPEMSSSSVNGQFIAGLQAEVKASQDAAKEEAQAAREAAEEKIRLAQEDYATIERNTEFEVRMGRMSAEQRLTALRTASMQEQQIRQQQSVFIQMLDINDQKRYEQDLRQQEQSTRQSAQQIQRLNQQSALDVQKSWERAYSGMTDAFSRNTALWMTGQQSLARSWQRTFMGMTQTVIENLLKQAIAFATNMASQDAIMEREKLKDAAAAARKTYLAVASIPVVGPFLAPAAAAGAFAAVEAFDAGGVVGSGMGVSGVRGYHVPILAEAGERVLTQAQSQNFERLVNQNTSTTSSSEVHFHDHSSFTGIDGASVAAMARQHGQTWRRETMRQLRLANKI